MGRRRRHQHQPVADASPGKLKYPVIGTIIQSRQPLGRILIPKITHIRKKRPEWKIQQEEDGIMRGFVIPTVIPKTTCMHCAPDPQDDEGIEYFDAEGRQLPKDEVQAQKTAKKIAKELEKSNSVFKLPLRPIHFMGFPPELRNIVYKHVLRHEKQPVCIPDDWLMPYDGFGDPNSVRQECDEYLSCFHCELHAALGTTDLGLAWANKQLHRETALETYAVNTFRLHSLYHLQTFLQIIGKHGRKALKSLDFSWSILEENAHTFGAYTDPYMVYFLLLDCSALDTLYIDMDVSNLLTWRGDGNCQQLQQISELPHLDVIAQLRGLKEVKFAWKRHPDLENMEAVAKYFIASWRIPRDVDPDKFNDRREVGVSVESSDDGSSSFVLWRLVDDPCFGMVSRE